ncbi:MAG: hypothetical protein COC14_06570 [Burkholderiaceae bacterium]|jgi:hypothetical protein|nr:hypothetical protein C3Z06_12560 [Cupriavidus metallidurans]KWR83824.1 hypothetical protein RN01_08425 [Cupriavidus sp. SHE]PCH56755.1 MAG: hypothetical protein COC14_06570 [Burkholderiaceae bacterium]
MSAQELFIHDRVTAEDMRHPAKVHPVIIIKPIGIGTPVTDPLSKSSGNLAFDDPKQFRCHRTVGFATIGIQSGSELTEQELDRINTRTKYGTGGVGNSFPLKPH